MHFSVFLGKSFPPFEPKPVPRKKIRSWITSSFQTGFQLLFCFIFLGVAPLLPPKIYTEAERKPIQQELAERRAGMRWGPAHHTLPPPSAGAAGGPLGPSGPQRAVRNLLIKWPLTSVTAPKLFCWDDLHMAMTGKAFNDLMGIHSIKTKQELILVLINDLLWGEAPHPHVNRRVTAVKLFTA